MKNYILILFVFLAMAAIAQNETPLVESSKEGSSATYSEQMSTIITELDKTEITTGILTDKSFGFVLMDDFNGVNTKVISLEKWREIYGQLYNAQIDNRKKFPLLESFPKAIFNTKLGIDVVPIAIMNIDYNRFKEDVLKNNLLTFRNGKLHDVLGRDSSPYLTNKLFASTPLKNKLYSSQVLQKQTLQKTWDVSKDKIEICKDCEFRYCCTDCRVFIDNEKNKYSRPSKCNYNPYQGLWEDQSGYVEVNKWLLNNNRIHTK